MEWRDKFTVCRLCLCETVSLFDIFQVNEWFGYVAAEVIKDLLQFQVSERDGYPNVICCICLGKLTDFKQFKERCLDSRDTYNNVFASDQSHAEHPVDIEEESSVKLEPKDPLDIQETLQEVDLRPVKLEPKDPWDTLEAEQEVDHDPANSEEEEETITDDILPQIRKRSVDVSSLDYLGRLRKGTRRESYGARENRSDGANDDGVPSSEGRKRAAVDGNPCENATSSGSANVKVEEIDVEVDCKSPGDVNSVVSSEGELTTGREDVNYVDVSMYERDSYIGEEARPLGVREREVTKDSFRCDDCGKHFEKMDALIRHLELHGAEVNVDSSGEEGDVQVGTGVNCGTGRKKNVFREKGWNRKTSGKATGDEGVRKHVCYLCSKGFSRTDHLKRHLRVHSGEKPFACPICGKRFISKFHLNRHKFIHTGVKPYTCDVCYKGFSQNCTLLMHRKIHTGEKPYVCKICGKKLAQNGSIAYHMRVHSGEKPYSCDVCGMKFIQNCNLTYHMRVHSGEKPYVCGICGKKFAQNGNLKKHKQVHG